MPNIDATVTIPADATFDNTLQALRRSPLDFVSNLVQTHDDDIVRLPFGTQDIYLLNHPDFIRDVFVTKSSYFAKRKDISAEGSYLQQMSGVLPLFEGQLSTTYAPIMTEAAVNAHMRWDTMHQQRDFLKVDIYKEVMQITLDIVFKTLFKVDMQAKAADLVDAIITMDVGYGFDPIAALLNDLAPPVTVSMTSEAQAAHSYLLNFMLGLVEASRSAPLDSRSLFSWLLKQQVNGQPISDEQIADQALKIIFSMHEVTATTLSWVWYLLAEYPNVEAQLHTELTNILAGRTPTFEDLPYLPYTEMVLKEVRRLYPSVWIVGRFVRDNISFGRYLVPAGSIVVFSQYLMHRDHRYFVDPDQFDPLRWTQEAQAARPEFSYFPFSAGPRQCAGRDFAPTKDALVLATLAQHWQARLAPNQTLEPYPQKSFTPRYGIQMTLHRR
ncbi:cytochrome P450 [Anabaena subtropica]|uniref:Cytochrome P450 n=1 Tax=Anabaena subtropica FACHB-260 TaxID=2692884 RepID=A0ABR8CM62_9NOST|nr:cytochrome P450 [Anabaena subtropica]MBD2344327.1 cytochrome P450 [Anabaena subtropica FACHB-260]